MLKVYHFQLNDAASVRAAMKELYWNIRRREVPAEQQDELNEMAATLTEAARSGRRDAFIPLTKPGDPISEPGRPKDRPEPSLLPWAVLDGHAEIVEALLSAGADPNEKVGDLPVLAMAADRGYILIAKRLLAAGASPSVSKSLIDPLSMAVKCQHADVVDLLIAAGADVNPITIAGSPLLQAVIIGNLDLMDALIKAGADVNMKWMAGDNLIATAINADELSDDHFDAVVRKLIEHGADVNELNNFGRTPLMDAAEKGRVAAVELLLECGADPNIARRKPDDPNSVNIFSDQATALILAARNGHAPVVSALLARGASLEHQDKTHLTALQWAKRNGHAAVAKILLEAGAAEDVGSPQALLAAAREGDIQALRKAIQAGVDVNARDEAGSLQESIIGSTALILAASNGHRDIAAELLKAGADIELQSSSFPGSTNPLMAAADAGHLDVMLQLIAAGADVNAKNKGFEGARWQPLHFAAVKGHAAAVALLIQHDAKINPKTSEKQTPLHLAASSGDLESVKLLLAAGADPLVKDHIDNTPRDGLRYAEKKDPQIAKVLQEAERATSPKEARPKRQKAEPAIPHAWKDAPQEIDRPDFATAANSDQFRKAIALVADKLNAKPEENADYPGARLFSTKRSAAEALSKDRRDALTKLGAMAFHGLGRGFLDDDADRVMLIPTEQWHDAVAFIQTADPNGGKGPGQVVAGLRQLYDQRPFYITQIAHDTVAGHFTATAKNSRALAKWMEAFCSDIIYQGVGSVSELARQLKESDRLFFWWD